MTNTVIRLGYISVSGGGGGGGGYEEYASLAAFPPVGTSGVIYLALNTNKLYRYNGMGYVVISPSEVTSVNTETGAVVLDKTDIGLGNVDNTSDLNKPISTATQTALDLITDVNWTGDYNNGVTYNVGDGVMFNGASFRMITFIGAAGYPPSAYPGSWLQITDYVSANDVGLGNVDNTSDADKPISDATQDALDDLSDNITKEIVSFIITDWTLSVDEYTFSVPAATHGKGTNPEITVLENTGSEFAEVILYKAINASGDIFLAVSAVPDNRFAGKLIIS